MQEKEYEILNYLKNQTSWVTASSIADNLNFSIRSVKSYIANINANYPNLILSSREGYFIHDKERLFDLLNTKDSQIPQSSKSRQAYILKLLLFRQQTKNLDELADELCISPATLANEISKIKKELLDFDLVFKIKNNCASIEGPEKNKKKMISHLIYNDIRDNFSLDPLQTYFPSLDLKLIKKVVTSKVLKNHYFINDFSLTNFILHLAIIMQRSVDNPASLEASDSLNNAYCIDQQISGLLDEILDDLKNCYNVRFNCDEYYNLALILTTSIVNENITRLSYPQLNKIVGSETCNLMSLIQSRVKDALNIDLNNPNFMMRFSLHLHNVLMRLKNKINLRNPQFATIKNTYPYIYDVSVFIANIIARETGHAVSEDEIAYISLHIGVLIEEQKALRNKVKTIILCPYNSARLGLAKKIQDTFEDSIILSKVVASADELEDLSDYDFLISTIDVNKCITVPVIVIKNYLDNKDIINIAAEIEKIKLARLRNILEKKLKFIFKKELFFYNPGLSSKKDVIDRLSEALYKYGYVDSRFREKIYERENISPSAYLNIAIPHPLEMSASSTAIAVSIHPAPIIWNENKVNVVFMLAIKEEDRMLFRDIFDFVTEIVLNKTYLQSLLKAKTYDDFINFLVAFA